MSRGLVTLGLVEPDPPEPPPDDGEPGPISPPLTRQRRGPGGIAVSTILHGLIIALRSWTWRSCAPRPLRSRRAPVGTEQERGLPAAARHGEDACWACPRAAARARAHAAAAGGEGPHQHRPAVDGAAARTAGAASGRRPHRGREGTAQRGDAAAPPPSPPATPPPQFVRDAGATVGEGGRLGPDAGTTRRRRAPPGPIHAALDRLETSGVGDPGPLGHPTGNRRARWARSSSIPRARTSRCGSSASRTRSTATGSCPRPRSVGARARSPFEFVVDRSGAVVER